MEATGIVVVFLCLTAVCLAQPKIGRLTNCPGYKAGVGIEATASWTPYALKPNTEYTINATITAHTDIREANEEVIFWIPERKEPIYKIDNTGVTCEDADVFKALQFVNVTCPIRKGTHKTFTNLKQFIKGDHAPITGNFIAEARLTDKKGKQLACLRAEFTISN